MKKLITTIVCVAVISVGFAQKKDIDLNKFTLGAKAGINVSQLVGKDIAEVYDKAKVGFHLGLTAEYRAARWFAIAPELMFISTQGVGIQVDNWRHDKYDIKSSYLTIPVMARFYVIDAFSIELGPQFGFTEGIKLTLNQGAYRETQKLDFKNQYYTFDFSLGFGVTYNYRHRFFASARYNYGLTDVLRSYKPYDNKNRVFQFSLGYNFFRR